MTTTTNRFRALLVTLAVVITTNLAISKVSTVRPSAPRPKAEVAQLSHETTAKVSTVRPSAPRP